MQWLSTVTCALFLASALAASGCGSAGFDGQGTDQLTMSFLGFSGEGIEQQDAVGSTDADVDVCQSICFIGGDLIDIEFEQFTQTRANAIFINNGTSDILLDRYTVSLPGSGIPDRTGNVALLLPGGTCSDSPTTECGSDNQCNPDATCLHVETPVEILLFDFVTKELIRGDATCPTLDLNTGQIIPGTVLPVTYQTDVTFSGSDASGERFTVRAGLVAGFFDANNCQASGGGDGN